MDLGWVEARLNRRLDAAEDHLASFLQRAPTPLGPQDVYELEGWLSEVWQIWCRFCRHVVMASCSGCQTASGVSLVASHASPDVVSFIASRQKNGQAPASQGTNTIYQKEPTWGHIDRLLEVIQALNPPNRADLLSAFGTVPAIEHVRLVRNATAHRNVQSLAQVLAFQSQYLAHSLRHPLHALFWTDPSTGRSLIHSRLDEMRVGAKNACA